MLGIDEWTVKDKININPNLMDIKLIKGILILIYKNSLCFYEYSSLTQINKIEFREDVFGLVEVFNEEFNWILTLNGKSKSTHLLMNNLNIVGKIEDDAQTVNILSSDEE